MIARQAMKRLVLLSVYVFIFGLSTQVSATIVRYETLLGNIDVRLYDTATPLSVQNFMNYVDDGDWDDSIIHRSVPGFVIQGGEFTYTSQDGVNDVPTDNPVQNEPGISNLRGTISYAKLGGDPNSATSQWFFNLADNSANLDNQNGGFTVFGRVLGDGMQIVDAIAALPTTTVVLYNKQGQLIRVLEDLPAVNWPATEVPGEFVLFDYENFTRVLSINELTFNDADYNFDGVVDTADYTVWRDSLGSTTQAEADGNGNGVVDQADYDLWAANLGATSTTTSLATTVPEPASGLMVVLACVGLVCRRR